MAFPTLVVEADFTTGPLSIPLAWQDLSDRVRSLGIHQGRQRLLDRTEVGTATSIMDNRDQALSAGIRTYGSGTYGSGIYGGSLTRPTNHFRARAVKDGVTYDLLRGFVKSWGQDWPGDGFDATTQVQVEDAFALLARYELENQSVAQLGTGAHLEAVLTDFGWPLAGTIPPGSNWWQLGHAGSALGTNTFLGESLRLLETGQSTIMALTLTGNLLEHLLNAAETTEGGTFYVGPSGDLIFEGRPNPHDPAIGIWGDDEGELRYHQIGSLNNTNEQIYNDVRVSIRGSAVTHQVKDASSQADHGPRTLSITDTLFSDEAQADTKASQLLMFYKDSRAYPTQIVMRPKPDSPLWPHILGTKLGSKLTVIHRYGEETLTLDCLLLGVDIQIDDFWEITWSLAPAEQILLDHWYLDISGSSELGTHTILG